MPVRKGVILDPVTIQPIGLYKGGLSEYDSLSFSDLFTPDLALQTLNQFLWEYYRLDSENYTTIQQEAFDASQKIWFKKDDNWYTSWCNSFIYLKTSFLNHEYGYKSLCTVERMVFAPTQKSKWQEVANHLRLELNDYIPPAYILARLLVKRSQSVKSRSCCQDFLMFLFRKYPNLNIHLSGYTLSEIFTAVKSS
jgi:hypothetical protein